MRRPAALIVDDQPFVGLVASDILRDMGFETFQAFDQQRADRMLTDHSEIEVVVTSARPGTSLEFARRMARERPDVSLVVAASDDEIRSADIPPTARILRKPYASSELATLVSDSMLLQDA